MKIQAVGRNRAGRLYGLTALCPITIGTADDASRSYESLLRQSLAELETNEDSLFTLFPNTYLARFYILKDVFYESRPARKEHLKSQYLVFASNFHGDLQRYLLDMWTKAEGPVRSIWQHCVGFQDVVSGDDFVRYIKACQVTNALLFNGSTDQPLAEQLKGLYLKQEFGDFAAQHQDCSAAELQAAFLQFLDRVQIDNLAGPTWRAGAATLDSVVVER